MRCQYKKQRKAFLFCEMKKMIDFDSSRDVVKRILAAYQLKTAKALADKWNIAASVIGSRIQRETFPADYVIKCVLDTGADLKWLCTGIGNPNVDGVKIENNAINLSSEDLEKLERIAALKKDGAITDDEYNLLKNSIFNK